MKSDPSVHIFRRRLVLGCAAILAMFGCTRSPQPQCCPTLEIQIGGRTLRVEAARTEAQRVTGMKHRRKLGPDEGMLFIFPRDEVLHFYMKDTPAPLSVVFLRSDGVILNIAHMEPLTTLSHRSRLPCRLALEMPQGWFAQHGVKEGDRIGLPPDLAGE